LESSATSFRDDWMGTNHRGVRVEAPADWDLIDVAQAVVGPHVLLKAEVKGSDRTFADHRVLRELSALMKKNYEEQMKKLLARIRAYVEEHIILGPLGKAAPGKPLVTPHELQELRKLIEDFHLAFNAGTVGPDTLSPHDVQRLIDAGILPADLAYTFQPGAGELPPQALRYIDDAYIYGKWLSSATTPAAVSAIEQTSYPSFVEKRKTIRLTEDESHAIEWARHSAANECQGLGNRVADDFSTTAIEADSDLRRRYVGVIREGLEENIQRRETWRKLASDLGHKTGDWARDFQRIASTEKQKAMQEGVATGLVQRHGDPKHILVAKRPNPDACDDCRRLHLTDDGRPRVFRLSELVRNGSNRGRKRGDWKPIVGPIHPWCACHLLHVPAGWAFNAKQQLVPESLSRAGYLEEDLRKAVNKDKPDGAKHLTYLKTVPEKGIVVRVGDPLMREEIEKIIAITPPEVFDKKVGVTLVTTDIPRVQNPLDDHDFAYWTGNEIRIMQTLPAQKIPRVLPHEIAHSLNVHLVRKMGSVEAVRKWHRKLFRLAKREGFVSDYAKKLPIECAAEVSMFYLYNRPKLMIRWPRQFAMVHKEYASIFRHGETSTRSSAALLGEG
jgi:hypothetical protein